MSKMDLSPDGGYDYKTFEKVEGCLRPAGGGRGRLRQAAQGPHTRHTSRRNSAGASPASTPTRQPASGRAPAPLADDTATDSPQVLSENELDDQDLLDCLGIEDDDDVVAPKIVEQPPQGLFATLLYVTKGEERRTS
jgi:hypothetical protein